jgi:hypothetical protein
MFRIEKLIEISEQSVAHYAFCVVTTVQGEQNHIGDNVNRGHLSQIHLTFKDTELTYMPWGNVIQYFDDGVLAVAYQDGEIDVLAGMLTEEIRNKINEFFHEYRTIDELAW